MKKNLVECKSLGIPLPEAVARQVDAVVRTLPPEHRKLSRKSSTPTAELVKGERADISMVSCETVDRDGDVILAKGMDLTFFQKNPIVTFAHKYDELPVGKAQWIKRVPGGLKAKTIYSEATDISRACWQMTQEGILKGKSIGFLPTLVRSPTKEEVSRNPSWKNAQAVIEGGMLLEYACCAIPVNQDALVEAVSKGITDHATLKRMGFRLPSRKLTREQRVKALVEAINRLHVTPDDIIRRLTEKYRA